MKLLTVLFIGWVAGAATLIALFVGPEIVDEHRHNQGWPKP